MNATPGKNIVVITGMSGSGKSTAVRALEDIGFFCIDNLPAPLLPKVTELSVPGEDIARLAFVIDVREKNFLNEAPRVLDELRRAGHKVDVLFLDADDEALIRRYSETRRRHPLADHPGGTVPEGIRKERALLDALRREADVILNTSATSVHELKRHLQSRFGLQTASTLSLALMSFGFRYGVPPQADMLFDVRFLPNPFFVAELKAMTGLDRPVADYVLERDDTREFLDRTASLIEFLLPRFRHEGKSYVTVAIGCTGGKHRSVAVGHALHSRLRGVASKDMVLAPVWDRDVARE